MNIVYKILFIVVCVFASTNINAYPFYQNGFPFSDVITDADAAVYVQTEIDGGGVTSFLTPDGNLALVFFDDNGDLTHVNIYDEAGNYVSTEDHGSNYAEVVAAIEGGGDGTVGPSGEGTENSFWGNEGCSDPYSASIECDSDPFSNPYSVDNIFNVTAG